MLNRNIIIPKKKKKRLKTCLRVNFFNIIPNNKSYLVLLNYAYTYIQINTKGGSGRSHYYHYFFLMKYELKFPPFLPSAQNIIYLILIYSTSI